MEELKHAIGEQIRAFRKTHGWSQEELASRIERSVYTLSLLERGVHLPSIATLIELASALECSLDDLVPGPGKGISRSKPREHRELEGQIHADLAALNFKTLSAVRNTIKSIIAMQE